MNRKYIIPALVIAAGGLLAAISPANATTDPKVLSPANQALFTSDHMASIKEPGVLVYDFERKGSLGDAFKDTIEAKITKVWPDGGKDVTFHFLSGAHHIEFRNFEDYVGNPIFMLFLERDVRELHRLTKGGAVYFRNRIRNALAGSATVKPTSFGFGGKTVKGTEIRIEPFANDPLNDRYPRFAKRSYVFLLSDEVPGGFYKVDSFTPDPSSDTPLLDESMTLRELQPAHQKRADEGRDKVAEKVK